MESINDSYLSSDYSENDKRTIDVVISLTLSKNVQVEVDDYKVYEDSSEDGTKLVYDYSECDLKKAVEEQIYLPQDLATNIKVMFNTNFNLKAVEMPLYLKYVLKEGENWDVDDFQVMLNE